MLHDQEQDEENQGFILVWINILRNLFIVIDRWLDLWLLPLTILLERANGMQSNSQSDNNRKHETITPANSARTRVKSQRRSGR